MNFSHDAGRCRTQLRLITITLISATDFLIDPCFCGSFFFFLEQMYASSKAHFLLFFNYAVALGGIPNRQTPRPVAAIALHGKFIFNSRGRIKTRPQLIKDRQNQCKHPRPTIRRQCSHQIRAAHRNKSVAARPALVSTSTSKKKHKKQDERNDKSSQV